MGKYNLVVVGGGLSGVAAAVSGARQGLKVLLVEKSGVLGGAMSNCLVYPFMPYWTIENGERKYLSQGIFAEMIERQRKYDDVKKDIYYSPEYFKLVLDDMVEESGIDVLFHATLFKVNTDNRKIVSVSLATKSGEMKFEADFFIDTTGDGDLFAFAGCDFQLGREKDNLCQPMTTCFRMNKDDEELFKNEIEQIQKLYKELQQKGEISNPRENILYFKHLGEGIFHFNTTRIVKRDPTNPFDLSKAEIIARKQIFEIVSFLKTNSKAFENSDVISIAADVGVRESRKLKGEHILTVEELKACTMFEDSIACGNYEIDIHNPEGTGTSLYYFKSGEYYTIPYRSLVPKEYDNLLVAGRCISATHEAQASVRIMPICACMGQAAGLAVTIACNENCAVKDVNIKKLQQFISENNGVY